MILSPCVSRLLTLAGYLVYTYYILYKLNISPFGKIVAKLSFLYFKYVMLRSFCSL